MLLALALIVPPVAIADDQPAAAVACVRHWHHTDNREALWPGVIHWQSNWRIVPHNSPCRDVNVSWASLEGRVKAQYRLRDGRIMNGLAGWKDLEPGGQRPWPVLITNLRNGTPYRIVSEDRERWYLVRV